MYTVGQPVEAAWIARATIAVNRATAALVEIYVDENLLGQQDLISEGSHGAVWRYASEHTGRQCAIKASKMP